MKKKIAFVLIVMMVVTLLLTGCGGGKQEKLATECLLAGSDPESPPCELFWALQAQVEADARVKAAEAAYKAYQDEASPAAITDVPELPTETPEFLELLTETPTSEFYATVTRSP